MQANNNTGSNDNVNEADEICLEGSPVVPNPWTHNIQMRIAQVDKVLNNPTVSVPENGDIAGETDATNRGAAADANPQLTESTLREMNATQSSGGHTLIIRPEGRERSVTADSVSVVAQPGSPRRQVADTRDEAVATDTSRRTLQELALDYGVDARNIIHGTNANSSQGPRQ